MTDITVPNVEARLLSSYEITQYEQNIHRLETHLEFLRSHPLIGSQVYVGNLYAYAGNKLDFQAMLIELGTFDKITNDYSVTARKDIGINEDFTHRVEISLDHSQFCEKVEDGVETIEEEVYPDDVVPTKVTKEVPKYKWVCPDSWKNA